MTTTADKAATPGRAAREYRAILVATDFSPSAAAAIDQAARLAVESQARLHVVHVVRAGAQSPEAAADERRRCLERIGRSIDVDTDLAVEIVKDVLHGMPHAAIVAYARGHGIDLIVMGTHGRTGLSRLALGSVAQRVLRDAPCPVFVVRDRGDDAADVVFEEVRPLVPESPAIDLVERARRLFATDVHIDPAGEGTYSVRMRIDGKLTEYCTLESDVAVHLVNRLKTLANLDIAAPFHPLEGRLRLPEGLTDIEVRITTAPVAGGEAVSLRILVRSRVFLPLENLGLSPAALETIRAMVRSVEGLVVVTGPTGSGKTTTVYSILESIASEERNMVSIEDPVELAVPFIRQMSVDERHGITLAGGLRTILRMDPDVVFVGEIRDAETAAVAMQAANSGRYVLSTMHARSMASTITAFADLRVDRRSLAGNLSGVINQRLVRRLCMGCRREVPVADRQRTVFEEAGVDVPRLLYEPGGCPQCRLSGYHGRIGIFEVGRMSPDIRVAIHAGEGDRRLQDILAAAGVRPLIVDALAKIGDGVVDFDEAMRVHWLA
jgi:type II secretory ATPase GspE/PulE/Tfp pilus assembly ATPase PilB-like protein/nucleotide-binding universal stress UspA family protein